MGRTHLGALDITAKSSCIDESVTYSNNNKRNEIANWLNNSEREIRNSDLVETHIQQASR